MKTKEEAFDDYFFKIQENHDAVDYILNRKSFEIGIEFAQRWIPLDEELPEEEIAQCCLWKNENTMWLGQAYQSQRPTHWRPIEIK